MRVKVALQTTFRKFGSSGPKPTKVKTTAAAKFKAMTSKSSGDTNSISGSGEDRDINLQSKDGARPYGSHSGNVHVQILHEGEINDQNLDAVNNYVAVVTGKLEAMSSWDLKKAKYDYTTFKNEVCSRYESQYGSELSEQTTTALLKELSEKSFVYTSHQIVITLISEVPIAGGQLNPKDNCYYVTVKSKMIYRKDRQLLPKEVRDKLVYSALVGEPIPVTNICQIPVTIKKLQNGSFKVVFNRNQNDPVQALDGYNLA